MKISTSLHCKKFVTIEIPTKPYCKQYIENKIGTNPIFINNRESDTVSKKFYDLLLITVNENKNRFVSDFYTAKLRIRIPLNVYKKYSKQINETNIKNFNLFVQAEIKDRFYFVMDVFQESLPCVHNNLPAARRHLGITADTWKDNSMLKDYYRYKKMKDNANKIEKKFRVKF